MTRREAIEASLAAWRHAERRLATSVNGEREAIAREVELHRTDIQQLSADHMVEPIGKLREAESRRSKATPSTLPLHEAARDTNEIASDIWEAARESDKDTPQTPENRRTTPAPSPPGVAAYARCPATDGSPETTSSAIASIALRTVPAPAS